MTPTKSAHPHSPFEGTPLLDEVAAAVPPPAVDVLGVPLALTDYERTGNLPPLPDSALGRDA